MTDYDVVICGGGPAGLTLAAALGAQGWRALVLEKQQAPAEQYKGEVLQPKSLEILNSLGLLAAVEAAGNVHAAKLECRDERGNHLVTLDYTPLDTPHNYVSVHYYHQIKDALSRNLSGCAEVERGTRVTGLLRGDTGRVEGVRAVRSGISRAVTASLVVGCEGQGSVCRSQAGLGTGPVGRYKHDLFSFDIEKPPALPPRLIAYITPQGLRLVYPMPHGRARMYVQIVPGGARGIRAGGLTEWLGSLGRSVPPLKEMVRPLEQDPGQAQALPARRWIAPRWSVPGLVLIGDAAHSVHPMAGQGMNAAIGDAWTLSQSLTAAAKDASCPDKRGAAIDAAVSDYERRRRPQVAYISRMSHHLALAFTGTAWPLRTMSRRMMLKNSGNQRMKSLLTLNMSGLDVRPLTFRDRFYQLGIMPDPQADPGRPRTVKEY